MNAEIQPTAKTAHHRKPRWDGRERVDRRTRPTPWFSRYTLFGRRRRNRRATDPSHGYYVDRADGAWLGALLTIVTLILLDGGLTLYILANGGSEVNPIMNWVYGAGWGWFLGVKVATAAIIFPFLSVHRFFDTARTGGMVLLVAYGGVMLVHVHTLLRIHF